MIRNFIAADRWRTLFLVALTGALLVMAVPRVFAAGEGVAETLGLRDADDHVRARLGAQTDGKYGLRIWDDSGALAYDLTPGAGVPGQPRVGTTIAELGSGMKDGETGYLRLGTGSLDSVPVTWDDTRGKWITAPQPLIEVHDDVTTTSATYASVSTTNAVRRPVLALPGLYDAGLRPEVAVHAFMRTGGAGSVLVRAAITELADGSAGSSLVATGGEVSVTGATNLSKFSGWTAMAVSPAPTQPYGLGNIQLRATSGSGAIVGGGVDAQIRWAG
jgi:hypothetical protein